MTECNVGQWCTVSDCFDPCTELTYCTQDYFNEAWDYFSEDCSEGVKAEDELCEEFCDYVDCTDEVSEDVCWKEECTNGCGSYNCSMWVQDSNGEWYGEVCPEQESFMPEIRVQDAAMQVAQVGEMYENTINKVFEQVCAPGDQMCATASQVLPGLLQGELPDFGSAASQNPEVAAGVQAGASQGAAAAQQALAPVASITDMLFSNEAANEIFMAILGDTAPATGLDE